ncbi:major facilitator superfamily domain-containing protein [Diaporthe sp. PMI_573]|nr:major facilitator superfamily domain-containing protein [Diaporthaceae sp. PMI_573]
MRPIDIHPDIDHITDRHEREIAILRILDSIGFNWPVFCAVAIGFLATSYSLFATNFVKPALLYVYPPSNESRQDIGEVLDLTTLSSTLVGMVVFGHFADRGGRKRLYGWELIILILATVGLVLSSQGFMSPGVDGKTESSMSIYASIIFFRCLLGFGIGAEYPVSAVIAAEFASTDTRAVVMASVFLMQSVGRFLAIGIGLGSLRSVMQQYDVQMDEPNIGAAEVKAKVVIDIVWRTVIGMGGVIALIAVGLRLTIPESPRYYSGILKDLRKAAIAVKQAGGDLSEDQRPETSLSLETHRSYGKDDKEPTPWFKAAQRYLKDGGWKPLLGISSIWFLLDVCFYGTSLDSPGTLNVLWLETRVFNTTGPFVNGTVAVWNATLPIWNADPALPNATIQRALNDNAVRTLLLSSIASLAGSLVAIPMVHYANRRRLLIYTSLALSLLFIATGASVVRTYARPTHYLSMVFFALAQFMFNVGPNTLTFIITAEVFPTVFRGSFYGIGAASGKLGAIVIRAIVARTGDGYQALVAYLFVFSVIMLALAFIAMVPGTLPEVQKDIRKGTQQRFPPSPTLAAMDYTSPSTDNPASHSWDAYFPRRWKSKALEDIARYPSPQDEFALQRDSDILAKESHTTVG